MGHGYMYFLVIVALSLGGSLQQVIDLDDSFAENKGDQSWLVMFHAPWCGHCRKLQPTFHQVSLELRNSDIKVGKIDATMFSSLASEYGVHGYPTIKFIKSDMAFTHKGERSKESIAEFARMAHGPQIRNLASQGKFTETIRRHKDSVFFLYVGKQDESVEIYNMYSEIGKEFPVLTYYYAGERTILPSNLNINEEPTLLVFKDTKHIEYKGESKEDMLQWIKSERFTAFPRVAEGGLNEMADLPKRIVSLVLDAKAKDRSQFERLKELVRSFALEKNDFSLDFQFIWTEERETANTITMSHVTAPFLFVIEPMTYMHYVPDIPTSDLTAESLAQFLQDVKEGSSQAQGGTGFLQRLKRLAWDIYSTVVSIYSESPWLALLVFGVPGVVISIVCYALCCLEPIDDENAYQEDGEDLTDTEQTGLDEDDGSDVGSKGHMKTE